jgi:hypothetical protein
LSRVAVAGDRAVEITLATGTDTCRRRAARAERGAAVLATTSFGGPAAADRATRESGAGADDPMVDDPHAGDRADLGGDRT